MRFIGDPSFYPKGWFDNLAVEDWLTDETAPSLSVSNDKFGHVTGSTTSSATIVGTAARRGTVTGSTTSTGTITGREGEPGAVTGSTTSSGTIAGRSGRSGAVAGSTTASGTIATTTQRRGSSAASIASTGVIVGARYDPDAPVEATRTGGGRGYAPKFDYAPKKRTIQAVTGTASGQTFTVGHVAGSRGHAGQAHGATSSTGRAAGMTRRTSTVPLSTRRLDGHARGTQTAPRDDEFLALYNESRRLRDDYELLLTL